MRQMRIMGFVMLVFVGFAGKQDLSAQTGIQFFEGTWGEALKKAKAENKLVFVDAYAVWCGPCRKMSSETFTNADVGAFFNKNFINYKFDMEKGEGPNFARTYGVRAYPTLFYIDGEGKVIHQDLGYKTADQLLGSGNTAKSKKGNS